MLGDLLLAGIARDRFAIRLRRLAVDERSADFAADGFHLGQVLTYDKDAPLRTDGEELAQAGQFGVQRR